MISVRCPFDGIVNKVGLLVEVQPGQATPIMRMCEHFVFEVLTGLAWDYLSAELHIDINRLPGVTAHEAEIENIVRRHLVFDETGRVAFAQSDAIRDRAKTEVVEFLQSRGYAIPRQ